MRLPFGEWLRKPVALAVVPVLALGYVGAWAVQGHPPFFGSVGCGPTAAPAASASPSPSESAPAGDGALALDFGFSPDPLRPDAPVAWDFTVTNVSEEAVTMTFSSGQDGDVVLYQGGQEKYRWSDGRSFTQAIRTVELSPGESTSFTLDDTLSVEAGSYDLVASVAADPAPSPAQRSVTVGTESASPAPEPSPDSTSPEPSPSPSPSPSPEETTTASVLATPLPMAAARRRRKRRAPRWRRALFAMALAIAVSVTPFGAGHAQEGGSGGKNVVIAINETDGRTVGRSGVAVGRAAGPSVLPENLASARASCTDCRTVAVALQSVVITSNPRYASPRNAAVAVNANCTRCQTLAYAWQYVISTGEPVRVTPEGEQAVADIRARAASLAGGALPFPELVQELDALAAEFRAVIDNEVERVGGRGLAADRDVKIDDQC